VAAWPRLAFSPSRSAASSAGSSTPCGKAASWSTAAWRTGQLSSATATSRGETASGRPDRPSSSTTARRTDSSPWRRDAIAAWMSRGLFIDPPPRSSLHPEDRDQAGQVLGLLGQVRGGLRHLLHGGQVVAGDLG